MSTPTTDLGGIQQVIRALRAAGWQLAYVHDGEEDIAVSSEKDATDAIMAVDAAYLHVARDIAKGAEGYVFFVLGNDPEEVVCDYTTNLDPTISDLTNRWFD